MNLDTCKIERVFQIKRSITIQLLDFSLGAGHDGEDSSSSCSSQNFVMTSGSSTGKRLFSACSMEAIKSYAQTTE